MEEEYHIQQLPYNAQKNAREVVNHIKEKYSDDLEELEDVKGGIAFKKKNARGYFAKIDSARRKCLILYLSTSAESRGLEYQEILDKLGIGNRRSPSDYKRYPHEAYIDLGKVNNIGEITKYVDDAFQLRP